MLSISIIIPAYNVHRYIDDTISSILDQTVAPHEVIVINDGSTDCTALLLAKYEHLPTFTIYHTVNRGPGAARNFGINKATGQYLYFLDSDDRIGIHFVEDIIQIIQNNAEPDIIFFAGISFVSDCFDGDFSPTYERCLEGSFTSSDYPIRLMQLHSCFYSSPCLFVSKKQLWVNNSLKFKNIIHEDEELIFPLVSFARHIIITKNVYFFRRLRKGSIMTSAKSQKNVDAYFAIVKSHLDFYDKYKMCDFFDSLAYKKRLRQFVVKYVEVSVSLSSKIDFWFIYKVALSQRDAIIFLRCILKYIRMKKYGCIPFSFSNNSK